MASKEKSIARLLTAAFLVLSPIAAAEDGTGFYAGFSAGHSKLKEACDTSVLPAGLMITECDDSSTGFKLYGGVQLGPIFGVEVGVAKLGETEYKLEPTDTTSTVETTSTAEHDHSIMAAVVARAPLDGPFKPFAKLGAHRWSVSADATGTTGGDNPTTISLSDDDDGFDIMYGVGVQYDFSEESGFSIRAEWERFELGFSEDFADEDKIDFISAGIVYRF